jgi:hypothetical protein
MVNQATAAILKWVLHLTQRQKLNKFNKRLHQVQYLLHLHQLMVQLNLTLHTGNQGMIAQFRLGNL